MGPRGAGLTMPVAVLAALALAAQPAPDDGPLKTAPKEAPAAVLPPGAEQKKVEIPPGATPASEATAAPPAVAGAKGLAFEPKTLVDGEAVQVSLGQGALFRLDDKGLPVLSKVEEGQLSAAHPDGAVTETFEDPPAGQVAAALDGSAEKRASVLKIWNQTGKPLEYRAVALVMRQGKVVAVPAPPTCAVAAHSVHSETWPRPVVAVGLGRFREASAITK